jgi:O-antigen/teichoic acid export membrane protein
VNLSTKVAYNTIIQFVSKVISTALGLLAMAMVARYLGLSGFGEYTTAFTFISFFAIMADLGLTLITVQMISQPDIDENKILGNLMGLRLVSAIILIGLGPIAVQFFPYSATVKIAVSAMSASFLFTALNQVFVGLFQKRLRMDKVSLAEVISRAVLVIGIFLAIRKNWGLLGISLIITVPNAISFLLHYLFSLKFTRVKIRFDLAYWKEIMSRSWPLALTIIFNLIYLKTDTILLSIINRPSKIGIIAEVGLYGAAYKVIEVLVTFPFIFAGIILPILTLQWAENNKQKFFSVLQKAFDTMAIFAIPLIIGTYFLAKDIVVLMAGEDFAPAGPILRLLIIAAAVIFLGTMFSHAIIAIHKQAKIIFCYLFVAVSSVMGYLIFIPRFSYFGAAWVTIYSETMIALLMMAVVWRHTRFLPKLTILFKSTLASIAMGAVLHILRKYETENLAISLVTAIPAYFIFLYLFKGLNQKDILNLLNKNNG